MSAAVEMEPGDVVARASELCRHGEAGYCYDDATPAEREAVAYLQHSAYNWALTAGPAGTDRDTAEEFACWTIRDSWRPGVLMMSSSHRLDFERFLEAR